MKLYLLNLNGAESGPFTEKQLRSMWLAGAFTVNAEWRLSDGPAWYSGDSLPAFLETDGHPTGHVGGVALEIQRRAALRETTAYPFARSLITVIAAVSLVAAALTWILAILSTDTGVALYLVAIGATLTALIYWAFALVAQALLDIADLTLKPR